MISDQGAPSGHEKFDELCALAMSGTLTDGELSELQTHLQGCEECREAYEQYQVLTKDAMPVLASRYGCLGEQGSWDDRVAREQLFARLATAERQTEAGQPAVKSSWPPSFHSLRRFSFHPIAAMAVAACMVVAVGIGAYRFSRHTETAASQTVALAEDRFQKLASEKKAVEELLSAQGQKLGQLASESSRKQQEIEKLRSQIQALEARSKEIANAKTNSDEQLRAAAGQRDVLAAQLREAQQAYQNVQVKLSSISAERDRATSRLTSLQNQVEELSAANRDQERRLRNQEQYLASDRDIRELMGARQLYIADVFDVSSDSRTRKPYGRVFYTRGKSLIFYAFDLDRQPGFKNASTFQAWGRKEMEQGKLVNLGILYEDSKANRRWALEFDDPKRLAEIDAIFVTIEPHGGSDKPTGKPFLAASLRKEVNHP